FTNMLSVGTAPILQPLVGFILACFKHYTRHPNSIHYQVYYYQWALGVLMVCLIAAAVLGHWMPLRKLR
ncbi:MAG TPA: MFS transporter, partial [Coxiellaceae bacterium]|nr:MFS transporter [Coxiellaceae bacterium]